jgi:hypothetical protein
VALCLGSLPGCGDDDQREGPELSAADAGHDASSIPAYMEPHDSGVQQVPPEFVPPDSPEAIPAHGDAAVEPDAAPDTGVPPTARDCLELEPGEARTFEAELTGERIWRRVEAGPSCPVTHVSAYDVAYELYPLCASASPRVLEIIMLGADRIEVAPRESVADPMLVVYPEERNLDDDPFACLAVNDDGSFDGLTSNSARIDRLEVAEGETPVIVATSRERPDQRGVGLFELTLRAE